MLIIYALLNREYKCDLLEQASLLVQRLDLLLDSSHGGIVILSQFYIIEGELEDYRHSARGAIFVVRRAASLSRHCGTLKTQ